MKNLILPFLLLLTFVFSCTNTNEDETLEKNAQSYDVYVGGTENYKACYWRNNQKTLLPGGENLNGVQICVDNNDVYVLARNIEKLGGVHTISAWYIWKNGVKQNVADYLNVPPNTASSQDNIFLFDKMIVDNGNLYFAGRIKNPNATSSADAFLNCFWKNGVKTVLPQNSGGIMHGGFELFNGDIYLTTQSNMDYSTMTWDISHYKNGNLFSTYNTQSQPETYHKNSSGLFLLEKKYDNLFNPTSFTKSYKNIHTNSVTPYPTNLTNMEIRKIYWNENDKYYISADFYYKNDNLIQVNDPQGYNTIGNFLVKDQNTYMTRTKNISVKFYINNVDTMTIDNIMEGCFNSICVVPN